MPPWQPEIQIWESPCAHWCREASNQNSKSVLVVLYFMFQGGKTCLIYFGLYFITSVSLLLCVAVGYIVQLLQEYSDKNQRLHSKWYYPQLWLLLFIFTWGLIFQTHLCFATNLNPKLARGEAWHSLLWESCDDLPLGKLRPEVMRWNRLISLYLLMCSYLSDWAGF